MKALMLAVVVVSTWALAAPGTVVAPEALPVAVRSAWAKEVAQARRVDPAAFAGVARVRSALAKADASKRGPFAVLAPALKVYSGPGVWALVEAAALQGDVAEGLPERALLAWHVGLLEALGAARREALAPLYLAALAREGRPLVAKAAAGALGKLGTDAATKALVEAASGVGVQAEAAQLGLGECRRLAATRALAKAAREASGRHQLALVRAMATQGSPWAWQTPAGKPPDAEAAPMQLALADALVGLYLEGTGDLRQHALDALAQLEAPQTMALARAKRAVDTSAVEALGRRLDGTRR